MYALFVNLGRTRRVEVWGGGENAGVWFAVRGSTDAMWGPPERLDAETTYRPVPLTMEQKVAEGVKRAELALLAYRAPGGVDTDDVGAVGDLIADLLHLLESRDDDDIDDALGARASARRCAERARDHYWHESDPENAKEAV